MARTRTAAPQRRREPLALLVAEVRRERARARRGVALAEALLEDADVALAPRELLLLRRPQMQGGKLLEEDVESAEQWEPHRSHHTTS